jgi:type IV pilus assembly protein PilQ
MNVTLPIIIWLGLVLLARPGLAQNIPVAPSGASTNAPATDSSLATAATHTAGPASLSGSATNAPPAENDTLPPATNGAPVVPLPPSPAFKVEAAPEYELAQATVPVIIRGANAPVDLAAAETSSDADEVIPQLTFNDADLNDVIKSLARQAKLNVLFDPALTAPIEGRPLSQPKVSFRLENVTARQVLEAVLRNHGLQLQQDRETLISRITARDRNEPLMNRVFQLQYSSPSNLVTVIKAAFPSPPGRLQVIPDARTSQLVIMAVRNEMEAAEALIKKLDTPTRQVLIEARLLETSQNPQTVKGIDWSGTLAAQRFSFGNGLSSGSTSYTTPGQSVTTTLPSGRTISTQTGSSSQSAFVTTVGSSQSGSGATGGASGGGGGSSTPTIGPGGLSLNTASGLSPNIGFLSADGVSAVLSFLNQDSETEVIATPRTVTLDNEKAMLSVTRAYPIFNITPGSASVAGGAQTTYTNLGTILNVTPRISGSNNIALSVEPEVSNIDSKDQQTINGQVNQANVYAIRRMETHVMIPSGYTLVMGGLISDSLTKSSTKVPVLGDLPVLGMAFRKDSKSRNKQNLLIFITPTIIKDEDFQHLPSSVFLKVPPKDSIDQKFGPWNSGKPYDWSKSPKNQTQ